MKNNRIIAEIKYLYRKDKELAIQTAKVLGYKIVAEASMPKPAPKDIDYAEMRLKGIIQKVGNNRQKQDQLANLRTNRTTDPVKLNAWIYVLTDEGWHSAAEYAHKKLKSLY